MLLKGNEKIQILTETEDWLAVQKPSGIATIPEHQNSDSLKTLLAKKYNSIFVVHRLDKDTSGIVLFAKNPEAHKTLYLSFQAHNIQKEYLAFVEGSLSQKTGVIEMGILPHPSQHNRVVWTSQGKSSNTKYEVMEDFGKWSLVKFLPYTGRMHQIRIHAKYIKHPIVCDDLYGNPIAIFLSSIKHKYKTRDDIEERPLLARLGLHASKIHFVYQSQTYTIESPLPKDMAVLLKQLQKWKK